MRARGRKSVASPVGDLLFDVLDPVLRRKAGLTLALLQSWPEIAGERMAENSRPDKIAWTRGDPQLESFRPATLTIACDSAMALEAAHETGEIIARVNAFFGYAAIDRVRIIQRTVSAGHSPPRNTKTNLPPQDNERLAQLLDTIADDGLRGSLQRLGQQILTTGKDPVH